MHLTNYAINKDNLNFVFNQEKHKMDIGHNREMEIMFEKLRQEGHDIEKLWQDIETSRPYHQEKPGFTESYVGIIILNTTLTLF
jgi:hypothetical protein